jgi:hypothetical protein
MKKLFLLVTVLTFLSLTAFVYDFGLCIGITNRVNYTMLICSAKQNNTSLYVFY